MGLLVTSTGDFITTSTGDYLYVATVTPEPIVSPTFSGSLVVGQTLTGSGGTWSDGTFNARKWQSADDGSGTGVADIGGATSSTYSIGFTAAAKYIRYAEQYTNAAGTTWAYSAWSGPVTAAGGSQDSSVITSPARMPSLGRLIYSPVVR